MKKAYIWIIIAIVIIVAAYLAYPKDKEYEDLGVTRPSEHIILDVREPNVSSISYDTSDDTIEFLTTDNENFATPSVGDTLRFKAGGTGTIDPLVARHTYFVVTASLSDRIEIASSSGGTVIDLITTASGGEQVREVYQGKANVDGATLYSFALDAEGAPSGSLFFVASIDNEVDFMATPSYTNSWQRIDVIDAESGASIDGGAGFRFTGGTDDHRQFYVDDARAYNWVGAIFEDYESGSFTIKLDTK